MAIARVDETGRSSMIRHPQGDMLIESIVYFEDDELVFGRAAKQAAAGQPSRAAEYVKRDLGQRAYSRAIGGELLPAEPSIEVVADVATGAEALALADISVAGESKPLVGLAVPACFDQAQRKALLDAGQIAGIEVLGTINDTLATALAFAETQGYLGPAAADKPGCRVLVFDLGSGSLDAAIVEIKPGRVRTMAVVGDARLGGRDWDARLADHLAGQFAKQFEEDPRHDMVSVRRLLESAAEAKHTLTSRQQARVHVERQGHAADITIMRQAFEEITGDLVEQAQRVVEAVLAQAAMAWRDVNQLLLVGGATRMPMIVKMLETLTELKSVSNIQPDEMVARGAALAAERLAAVREGRASKVDVEIIGLTSHSLGIEWDDPQTHAAENVVIIRRGTELPCATASTITTTIDDQPAVVVQLLEGESRKSHECSRIAELTIGDLPPGLPKGSPIAVQYQFTAEGRLLIKAQVEKPNKLLSIEVRRHRGLSDAQVAGWKKLLDKHDGLKPILVELANQQKQAPSASSTPVPMAIEPAPQRAAAEHDEPVGVSFDFESAQTAVAGRSAKRKTTPRKLAIMVAGHVVFSTLGLLIGYYILVRFDPSKNWLHLPLPGIAEPAPVDETVNTEPRQTT